jgi:hypothetical protein
LGCARPARCDSRSKANMKRMNGDLKTRTAGLCDECRHRSQHAEQWGSIRITQAHKHKQNGSLCVVFIGPGARLARHAPYIGSDKQIELQQQQWLRETDPAGSTGGATHNYAIERTRSCSRQSKHCIARLSRVCRAQMTKMTRGSGASRGIHLAWCRSETNQRIKQFRD